MARKMEVGARQKRNNRRKAELPQMKTKALTRFVCPPQLERKEEQEAWKMIAKALKPSEILMQSDLPSLIAASKCLAQVLRSTPLSNGSALKEWRAYSKMFGLDPLSRQSINPPTKKGPDSKLTSLVSLVSTPPAKSSNK